MIPNYLFVDDSGRNAVEILRVGDWKKTGSISLNVDDPHGDWFSKDHLYVANYDAADIAEYDSSGSLTYTYSRGMQHPAVVTSDSSGNVYEGDYTGKAVKEYHRDSNTVVAGCDVGALVEGVAVDKQGDVFVAYFAGEGRVIEYIGGLSGCNRTALHVTVGFPGSMVLDNRADLILVDQLGPTVDVIETSLQPCFAHTGLRVRVAVSDYPQCRQ